VRGAPVVEVGAPLVLERTFVVVLTDDRGAVDDDLLDPSLLHAATMATPITIATPDTRRIVRG